MDRYDNKENYLDKNNIMSFDLPIEKGVYLEIR